MGCVWTARHVELGTPAAVKLIDASIATSPDALARFKYEAQAAAMLRSPYVVQILDYGVDRGTPYIAMELLKGETLAARLRRLGRLSPTDTARILGEVCRAIGNAHAAGIVHRDLKPDNIFLASHDDEEAAKVLDFGVAKRADRVGGGSPGPHTRTGAVMGTPNYMSPGQASGQKTVDHRADIWAAGVIAYECLSGQRPVKGSTVGQVMRALARLAIPPLAEVAPHVPADLARWVHDLLSERDARIATVEAAQSGLELSDLSHTSPAAAPPGGPGEAASSRSTATKGSSQNSPCAPVRASNPAAVPALT